MSDFSFPIMGQPFGARTAYRSHLRSLNFHGDSASPFQMPICRPFASASNFFSAPKSSNA